MLNLGFLEWLSFNGLMKWAHDALVAAWDWLAGIVSGLFGPLWSAVASAIQGVSAMVGWLSSALSGVAGYINFVNAWVPVDVFINCVIVYSSFWLALVVYRSVKKWIPTVSG